MSVTVDTSQVRKLGLELTGAGPRAVPAMAAVVAVAANGVRDTLRAEAQGHRRFPAFPRSITADVRGLQAEIGPDKNLRQGALGNLLYFGTSKSGPTLPHPERALEAASPGFVKAVEETALRVLAGDRTPIAIPAEPPRGRDARGRFV